MILRTSKDHLITISMVLLCAPIVIAQSNSAVNTASPLTLGQRLERELGGNESHEYQLTLASDQYANVIIDQRGIDLVVQLLATDGKKVADFDREIRTQGEERIEIVADQAGNYRLLIKPKFPKLAQGRYEIQFAELRAATNEERTLHEARKLYTESKRLIDAGKYSDAMPLAERAVELIKKVRGEKHPDLVYPLLNVGVVNYWKGDYFRSVDVCEQALTIAETTLGPEHPWVARMLYNLAVFYSGKGDDERAERLHERSLTIQEKVLGPTHQYVGQTLTQLGFIFRRRGDFARAEPLFLRGLSIAGEVSGENSEDVALASNFLGGLYREKGDYLKAEPYYRRALAIYEQSRGPDHPFVAPPLNNLANLYVDMGEFAKAEPLYQRAISIREKTVGPDHPDVANTRTNLAVVYSGLGDNAKAETLCVNALQSLEKTLGPNHPLTATTLVHLAKIYLQLNDYDKAEPLYQRGFSILETTWGENHYRLADILNDLARLSALRGNPSQAITFQTRANAIIEYNVRLNLTIGSERQKLAYLAKLPEQLNQAVSLHTGFAAEDRAARELAALSVLQRKGRVQDVLSTSLASLRNRFNDEDKQLLDQLNEVTSRLASLTLSDSSRTTAKERHDQIKTLEEQREKLEAMTGSRSAEFYAHAQPVTLAAIREAIPDDAALIELAVYRPFRSGVVGNQPSMEPRYVAYVMRRTSEVGWKELGPAEEINKAVANLRRALRDPTRPDVGKVARIVDQKVMQPIRALIGNASHLLVSPDGDLNLLPFAALKDEQGNYLVKRYSFSYLTSGRDLLRMQVAHSSKSKPVVVADPTFGNPLNTQMLTATAGRNAQRSVTSGRDLSEVYFAPLNGTALEANTIEKLFPEASLLAGLKATESAVKQVVGPRLLHIATHGFFLQETGNADAQVATRSINATVRIENPLLRSGLALTGANLHSTTGDDGLLTALEASGLNLWGTKLVVLSACDTGVGEVRNGEGVYGLRRAFVLAGAESLVMSLWPASDYTTRKLMTEFYRNLKLGLGRGEALRSVQLDMLKRNPQLHPFYWANFIQSGEWASLDGKR